MKQMLIFLVVLFACCAEIKADTWTRTATVNGDIVANNISLGLKVGF